MKKNGLRIGCKGFSLVELSIVLVILGLLVGGVLSGKALIRASELRAFDTQYQTYIAAAHTFRDKYFGLPADITNATAFWGTAAVGASCRNTIGTGTQTCDGNGDGLIAASATSNERYRFWQHLVNAGLIGGSFSGVSADGGTNTSTSDATNVPVAKAGNAFWDISYTGYWPGVDTDSFALDYGRSFHVLAPTSLGTGGRWLRPEELWNMDIKLDDGKPAQGKIVARQYASSCTNATSVTDYAADYKLTVTSVACVPVFRNAY